MEQKMYIDPGFGSLLFQSCAAMAVSFGIFWVRPIEKIRHFLKKSKSRKNEPSNHLNNSDSVDENGFLK